MINFVFFAGIAIIFCITLILVFFKAEKEEAKHVCPKCGEGDCYCPFDDIN